jgi:hypothetical protein
MPALPFRSTHILARPRRALLSTPGEAPDPELTARLLSTVADEYARLLLGDPRRFPPERLLLHARWWLGHLWS